MEKNAAILIVDDDQTLLRVLAEMLMELGWSAVTASTADLALDMVKAGRYQMAFVDNRLAHIEGSDLIQCLQHLDPELPCVLMSGDLNIDATVKALQKGAAGFLRKPFRVESLMVSIEHANKTREFQQRAKELLEKYAEGKAGGKEAPEDA